MINVLDPKLSKLFELKVAKNHILSSSVAFISFLIFSPSFCCFVHLYIASWWKSTLEARTSTWLLAAF